MKDNINSYIKSINDLREKILELDQNEIIINDEINSHKKSIKYFLISGIGGLVCSSIIFITTTPIIVEVSLSAISITSFVMATLTNNYIYHKKRLLTETVNQKNELNVELDKNKTALKELKLDKTDHIEEHHIEDNNKNYVNENENPLVRKRKI